MLGHRRHAWRANDGPFIAVFESSIPSSTKKISNDPRMHVVLSPLNEKSHLKQSLGSKVNVSFFSPEFLRQIFFLEHTITGQLITTTAQILD